MAVLVEACVDAIDAALEAARGGAGRIELCGELLQGGVTPSAGLIGAVRDRVRIPLFVLIRPRTGDFLYTSDERDVMRRDIAMAKSLGAAGVVLGALTVAGDVDGDATSELIAAARPMAVTFHRAFDFARDQDAALDALLQLGADRVLTSGGSATAIEGIAAIRRLVQRAGRALTVLAGGSITAENVAAVTLATGVTEVHVRGSEPIESLMRYRHASTTLSRQPPPSDYGRVVTRAHAIRNVVSAAGGNG